MSGTLSTPTSLEIPFSANDLLRALLSLPTRRQLSILDSCGARDSSEHFLIAGFDPFEIIEARASVVNIIRRGDERVRTVNGNALELLDGRLRELRAHAVPNLPVAGACIATISYDLVRSLERLHLRPQRRLHDEPDLYLAFYDTLIVHDYENGRTWIVGTVGRERLEETLAVLDEALARASGAVDLESHTPSVQTIKSNLTRDRYIRAVQRIKKHIAAGDIYQANLTQQLTCTLSAGSNPETIFLRLRRDHPVPFAAFVRRRDDVVVSASPERFLRVRARGGHRVVEAWPIKGTRRRGRTPEEDERLRAELLRSEKDRAENIMIVDLARNDLGRVCRYGSIHVTELCALQEHPTLFHLVSKVRGTLRDDVGVSALVGAAFPCGSITGAPKIRAVEIIAETEDVARGLSMGALGYFSFDGALDLNVAIRTMVLRDHLARFNVGGGIVADSQPELEYEESLTKARSLVNALGVAPTTDLRTLLG
ncbi:MAG TPA: aminodeoxychorismate synthase component I [Pyrinomonadaceae bacterium]